MQLSWWHPPLERHLKKTSVLQTRQLGSLLLGRLIQSVFILASCLNVEKFDFRGLIATNVSSRIRQGSTSVHALVPQLLLWSLLYLDMTLELWVEATPMNQIVISALLKSLHNSLKPSQSQLIIMILALNKTRVDALFEKTYEESYHFLVQSI